MTRHLIYSIEILCFHPVHVAPRAQCRPGANPSTPRETPPLPQHLVILGPAADPGTEFPNPDPELEPRGFEMSLDLTHPEAQP